MQPKRGQQTLKWRCTQKERRHQIEDTFNNARGQKNGRVSKNQDNPEIDDTPKNKMTTKWKATQKIKTTLKIKTAIGYFFCWWSWLHLSFLQNFFFQNIIDQIIKSYFRFCLVFLILFVLSTDLKAFKSDNIWIFNSSFLPLKLVHMSFSPWVTDS